MSLLIKGNDPYDDNSDRAIVKKFLQSKKSDEFPSITRMHGKYEGTDMGWSFKGITYAVEVARCSEWPIGKIIPDYVSFPARKIRHMFEAIKSEELFTYDTGIYCIISKDTTHIAIFSMEDLLQIDTTNPDNILNEYRYNEKVTLIKIPFKSLLKGYRKLGNFQ